MDACVLFGKLEQDVVLLYNVRKKVFFVMCSYEIVPCEVCSLCFVQLLVSAMCSFTLCYMPFLDCAMCSTLFVSCAVSSFYDVQF